MDQYEEMRRMCLEYADKLGEAKAIIKILLICGVDGIDDKEREMAQEFIDRSAKEK